MELKDSIIIKANNMNIWEALNTAEILKDCIPGCTDLTGNAEIGFEATVTQKIGPVKATFKGSVSIFDVIHNKSYTIRGEGKGGVAGFAKGEARVSLRQIDDVIELSYEVEAKVGGKIAQLGGRLIDGFAKNMAKKFFETFKKKLEPPSIDGAQDNK